MKALITGIRGFVGGHMTRLLLERGDEVAGLDADDKDFNVAIGEKPVKVYKGDLRDEDIVSKALTEFKPDCLFHLAAQSSVKLSFENPLETFSANLIGTLILLETVSKLDFPVKTLVISSSEVYGRLKPEECPVGEDHPMNPINPYAVSKASVDLLARQYHRAYQMPVYIARAFSHSGPGQKTVAVLSDWALQIAKIELGLAPPILKVGNIKVQRDYTDVRDIVRAYLDIIEKGQPGKPYNVCSAKGYKLSDLLEKYQTMVNKKFEVTSDKSRLRPIDIPILTGSYELLKADTGWGPKIPIEKTLRDSLKSWHNHLIEEM
ncbi:MAG: GDP-mannose 4,6-dehydratase [candidate division Zixibacteria bacterium]